MEEQELEVAQEQDEEITKWEALPLSNDFIFSKVMADQDLCKEVAELLLGKEIREIASFQEEKSINLQRDSRSIRLDVYLQGSDQIVNIEMQARRKDNIQKRSRYYQDIIDLEFLEVTQKYWTLPPCYVIFICTFDLIGNKKARNSYQNRNDETGEPLGDGTHKIFYNAKAHKNTEDPKLKAFLQYVCGESSEDPLVQKLEARMTEVKNNTKWRTDFMKYEVELSLAKAEGEERGIEQGIRLMVKNLLDVLDDATIALKSGLSKEIVAQIRAEN